MKSRISDKQAQEILNRFLSGEYAINLAKEYGIGDTRVGDIVYGRSGHDNE